MSYSTCCLTPDCPWFDVNVHVQQLPNATVNKLVDGDKASNRQCVDGLIVPIWGHVSTLELTDKVLHAAVYFLAMCYLFVGVSIIADRFMAAIEVITSLEREVKVKKSDGSKHIIVVRVWNETVANLTLMALGSSAPEIMLSVIEIYAKNFVAGDLGPGTIVGSAAFNLFIIIGICVYVIPSDEVRKIKHLRVFIITATWSVFAYVWLYFILAWSSYGEVEVWEALLTFFFFPATVLTAYVADRRFLFCTYLSKNYRLNRRGVIVEAEAEGNDDDLTAGILGKEHFKRFDVEEASEEIRDFEENRREFISILKELRHNNPAMDMALLEAAAMDEILKRGPRSRAYYRIQVTRKLTGRRNLAKKTHDVLLAELQSTDKKNEAMLDGGAKRSTSGVEQTRLCFNPGHYTVVESVGYVTVNVTRDGGDMGLTVIVDYRTEDGTAVAGCDYERRKGTLVFRNGIGTQAFSIKIIDNEVFQADRHFYVRLINLRVKYPDGTLQLAPSISQVAAGKMFPVKLDSPALATVMILDDDHCGMFHLEKKDVEVAESIGECHVKVMRYGGARGRVALPYRTLPGTAKPGKEYEHVEGELIFENEEYEKYIRVPIVEEETYEKDALFFVEIMDPRPLVSNEDKLGRILGKAAHELTDEDRVALMGKPKLGENTKTQIRIKESKEFKNTVDKLLKRANANFLVGTSSWREQFKEALTVSAGDDDDENCDREASGETEPSPTFKDYVVHVLTVFWKLLFAFVPPTDYWGGWLCFSVCIIWIGILTAFIGDVAGHFGCTIGLADQVTAISFVALGTSIPDTFASKVAAVQDKHADASIGNVTGSNAVNVFLGIGIAWSWAAIYHSLNGTRFCVHPGNLAFSVTIFCSCAAVAITVLLLRRLKRVGGELGGPRKYKLATALLFAALWVFYVVMSSLEVYGLVKGF